MQKISDFFAIEAYFDEGSDSILRFDWEEGGESYIYDWENQRLVEGDPTSYTYSLIKDWIRVHKNEVNQIFAAKTPHYIFDDAWNTY